MKVTIAKLFELSALGTQFAKLEPLVSFVNTSVEQIVKALQGRLTIRDNGFAEIRELTFKKPTAPDAPWTQEFTPAQRTVEGLLVLQSQSDDGNTVASWSYAFTTRGTILISIYPRLLGSSESLTVKFAALFQ